MGFLRAHGFSVGLAAVAVFSLFCQSSLFQAYSADEFRTDFIYLTGKGDSMLPTIASGDRITVRLHVNISSIQVGDILVYAVIAAIAYIPQPDAMFIGHRVVQKYQRSGSWVFRTKGDNNPEADPYEVPEVWVIGLVEDIHHVVDTPYSEQSAASSGFSLVDGIVGFSPAIALVVLVLGVVADRMLKEKRRKPEEEQGQEYAEQIIKCPKCGREVYESEVKTCVVCGERYCVCCHVWSYFYVMEKGPKGKIVDTKAFCCLAHERMWIQPLIDRFLIDMGEQGRRLVGQYRLIGEDWFSRKLGFEGFEVYCVTLEDFFRECRYRDEVETVLKKGGGTFTFKTMVEANEFAQFLTRAYPYRLRAKVGTGTNDFIVIVTRG